jgi:hypothetical protein
LNSLSRNEKPKQDPKIPTQKNVNDLKSALAAVISKANAEKNANLVNNKPEIKSDGDFKPLSTLKDLKPIPKVKIGDSKDSQNHSDTPVISSVSKPVSKEEKSNTKEVPEEVLKGVLKVD